MNTNKGTDSELNLGTDSAKESITYLIKGMTSGARGNNHNDHETRETNVTPVVTPESRPKRDRKLTEKGLQYKLDISIKERNEAHSKLTKQVKRIYSFLHEGIDYRSLENERETLDSVKE